MARQGPPMAQTPEGRRRTRQRIVFLLVIFAAIAASTLYTNFDLMNNSDVASSSSSSSSSSITRVLPRALHHVHVPTYEEASEWAHHMLHPEHDDDDHHHRHHPTRSDGNDERSGAEEEDDNASGGGGDADGEGDEGAGEGGGAGAGPSEAIVERSRGGDGNNNDEGSGGGGGEGTGEEGAKQLQHQQQQQQKQQQQHEVTVDGESDSGDDATASSSSQPPDLRVGPDGKPESEDDEVGGEERKSSSSSGGGGGGGKVVPDPALAAAYRQSTSRARCMGAPADMMPTFVQQKGLRKRRSDTLPSRPGYVGVSHIEGIGKGTVRARTENGPRKAKQESTVNPKVSSAAKESSLVSCLEDLSKCTHESRVAAWGLKGVREARVGRALPGIKRHKRCAVVGNSGGMLLKEYGSLIDKHDAVIRINVLENSKYFANLGKETTYRVLSYKMAKDVCCIMPPNKHPPDNKHMSYLVWFPAMRKQIVDRIKQRYKQPVIEMSGGFLNSAVGGFKTMRDELVRLGFGPFEDWEYMTSGMHAILAFSRSCETLDVYGFTTDVSAGPYWFTGRKVAPQSGRRQHSWDHERMILRLLHAAGHVNICA